MAIDRSAKPMSPAEGQFYQAILRAFPAQGGPPAGDWLAATAAWLGLKPAAALATLARRDLLGYDAATGALTYVYPFSGPPTAHRVTVEGLQPVYAMCAIDALGIPLMLGRDATISSADPATGEPVRVDVRAGQVAWDPPDAVVVASLRRGAGPAARECCPHINFFRSPAAAGAYVRVHPDQQGRVLTQEEAIEAARRRFGGLLAAQGPACCCG